MNLRIVFKFKDCELQFYEKRRLFCYFSVNPCMPAGRWRRFLILKSFVGTKYFLLKPSLLVVSSAAMLALSPSSKISSERSFLPIPASSGLSSTVSSFLVSPSAAVKPTPTSSPSPTPETFQKLVFFPYLSIVT